MLKSFLISEAFYTFFCEGESPGAVTTKCGMAPGTNITMFQKECLMEIKVYDTYAQSEKVFKIHFDVMLPIGGDEPTAKKKVKEFGEKISEITSPI